MPQSLAKVLVHLIFSTKYREPTIPLTIRPQLHAYISGILANLHCPSLQTGGAADHVHTLLSLARTQAVADITEEIKKSSSKWMKQQGIAGFFWQGGYGAFSIGEFTGICSDPIHRTAGGTPSSSGLPRGIPADLGALRRRVRRAVRLGLNGSRPFRAFAAHCIFPGRCPGLPNRCPLRGATSLGIRTTAVAKVNA
jgi:putative transposase